jgi:hypothetical protein
VINGELSKVFLCTWRQVVAPFSNSGSYVNSCSFLRQSTFRPPAQDHLFVYSKISITIISEGNSYDQEDDIGSCSSGFSITIRGRQCSVLLAINFIVRIKLFYNIWVVETFSDTSLVRRI